MTGNILIVFAMISISVYWVLSKKFQSIYSPLKINNYFILSTTILLFFLSFYDIVKTPNWYHNVSINAYAALIFIAIFCTAITYLLNQILIKRTTPVLASMVLYLQPFATFIRAYIFLSEGLSLLFIIGAGITLLGIGIYNFSKNTNL